jgi:hypothetical protein
MAVGACKCDLSHNLPCDTLCDKSHNWLGYGHSDPPESRMVKEIEYDPIKIRAEQMERELAQPRQVERGQE